MPVIRGGGGIRALKRARVWGRKPGLLCFLFASVQLQNGQCAFPNSLHLFVQSRGVFLGACTFIAACIVRCHGQCAVWLKLLTVATPARHNVGASSTAHAAHLREHKARGWAGSGLGCSGCGSGWWVDSSLVALWFALLARCASHCLPAWFAALRLLSVVSALAGFIHLLVKGTLLWFVVRASRGHHFALGTGGLQQSLLGGIGPVYSLPKDCFKPFRSFNR